MKKIFPRKSLLLCLAMLSLSLGLQAQGLQILEYFAAREYQGDVYLNWTIESGYTCNGIEIMRSTDGIHYAAVGRIEGVCGSPGSSVAFEYIDTRPVENQRNYYALELGAVGRTEHREVLVVNVGQSKAIVSPNPIQDQAIIYFDNDARENCQMSIFDRSGILQLQLDSREEYFVLDGKLLENGHFLYLIMDEGGKMLAKGKLLIAH